MVYKKTTFFARFFSLKLLIISKKNVIIKRYNREGIPLAEKNKKKKVNRKESMLVTKESLCAVCAIFSFLALLILCTRSLVFGDLGLAIHCFLTGVFGYMAYLVFACAIYVSVMKLIDKPLFRHRGFGVCCVIAICAIALIVHTALTYSWAREGYLARCFFAGERFPDATVFGWVGALIVYTVSTLMSMPGTIVFFSSIALFCIYLCYVTIAKGELKREKPAKAEKSVAAEMPEPNAIKEPVSQNYPQTAGYNAGYYETPMQGYNGVMPQVVQRPGVTLQDEAAPADSDIGAFSPFGTPQNMKEADPVVQPSYEDSRAFLFGASPAENYKRNLIFDPNSSVNKRGGAEVQESYTPSYTEAYQSAVNEGSEREIPLKVVNETPYESVEKTSSVSSAYPFGYSEPETIAPMQPIEEEEPRVQEPTSYLFGGERFSEPEIEREPTPSFERNDDVSVEEPTIDSGYARHNYMDLFSPSNPNVFGSDESLSRNIESRLDESFAARGERFEDRSERSSTIGFGVEDTPTEREPLERRDGLHLFDEEPEDPYTLRSEPELGRDRVVDPVEESRGRDFMTTREPIRSDREEIRSFSREETVIPEPPKPVPAPPKPRVIRPYVRMPLDDFDCRDIEPTANQEEVEETKQTIIATLEDFKVTGASIASVTFGPTVTRYNVTLPRSISPRKVVALDQSIAISLHSSGVNIYPNYEDGVVSIEVPNKERQFVQLGCMLSGDTFVNAKSSSLMFTMGKNVANRKIYGDISKMIHMLVAGSSGSGKSVFLGALIVSMIYKYSPEELRLILIDPKKTEFVLYNNLPHLMINEIITDVNKAVQSLNWAIGEMNRRYGLFEQMSRAGTYVVNLDQYNAQLEKSKRLPKIVIIIDELADLMLAAKKEMEDRIQNLTQKARAAGIHLIVATQRPSTDVITGVIKSNLPTRIAFYVATDVDSRVILDQSGAQKLLGKGDFLYTTSGINTPVRVQSAFISPEDSQKVVNFIKANNEAYYDEEATAYINNTRTGGDDFGGSSDKADIDPIYIEALRYVILSGSASISMIQRKCSAGYNRAGKIIEWMEDMGYISAFDGAKARKVLITKEDFESKYGPLQ